jgi:hypothetical protein
MTFGGGEPGEGEDTTGCRAFDPDSAPPAGVASDSGQVLAWPPNRSGLTSRPVSAETAGPFRPGFRRHRNSNPATDGRRTSTVKTQDSGAAEGKSNSLEIRVREPKPIGAVRRRGSV